MTVSQTYLISSFVSSDCVPGFPFRPIKKASLSRRLLAGLDFVGPLRAVPVRGPKMSVCVVGGTHLLCSGGNQPKKEHLLGSPGYLSAVGKPPVFSLKSLLLGVMSEKGVYPFRLSVTFATASILLSVSALTEQFRAKRTDIMLAVAFVLLSLFPQVRLSLVFSQQAPIIF